MSRNHDNSSYRDQRGRSDERSSSRYSSSQSDSRSQYPRPRHQQTSQGWQNGNYYQSNSYNSNYQYQNRSRPNRPGYTTWNQQWGGYSPQYQTPQWGQPPPVSFNPHSAPPPFGTPKTSNPIKPTSTSESPALALGSKERDKPPVETTDQTNKVQLEPRAKSPSRPRSNLDRDRPRRNDNLVDRYNLPTETPEANRSGPKQRISLIKPARDVNEGSSSTSSKQTRRSSSDSNNAESINPPKSSPRVSCRSRSSSLSSSTNVASSANKHGLQSPASSKEAKQRVIKELLGMNRVKLKELVTHPRSRKIDMVMKYMIKESRAQQSHKQRQLAQAGIEGTHSESSNTLEQQDVEALLSDPDLHISLSNLPTEMIETLGNVFKLNSEGSDESEDQGSVTGNIDISSDLGLTDVDLDCEIKAELNTDDVNIFKDVKPLIDLCSSNQTSPDACRPKHSDMFSHDITNPLDSVTAIDSASMPMLIETESVGHKDADDNFMRPNPIDKIPVGLQSIKSSSLELPATLEKCLENPELLEAVDFKKNSHMADNDSEDRPCSLEKVGLPSATDVSVTTETLKSGSSSSCLDILSSQQIIATPESSTPPDLCKISSKDVGTGSSNEHSSLSSDRYISEKCISLSESKEKPTSHVVDKHGTIDTDHYIKIDQPMVSETMEHEPILKLLGDISEKCISLSESKENTSSQVVDDHGTINADHYKKIDQPMVSETMEHEPILKLLGDTVADDCAPSQLVQVKDQEALLKFVDATTKPSHPDDIISTLPTSIDKNCNTSVLSTPVTESGKTDNVDYVLKAAQNISSEKEGVMSESVEQIPLHLEGKSLSPMPVVVENKSDDRMEVDKHCTRLGTKALFEVGAITSMDPMCILYESDLVMASKLGGPQKLLAKDVTLGTRGERGRDPDGSHYGRVESDASNVKNPLPRIRCIQVKSEREENDAQTLHDETPHCLSASQPIMGPSNEVSTQTERFSNTETNVSSLLLQLKASCENTPQMAAFNQLNELLMTKVIDPINVDSHTRPRRRPVKSDQQTKPHTSQRQAPIKNPKRPAIDSTNAQNNESNLGGVDIPSNLSDPILLNTTVLDANEEPVLTTDATSEGEMATQEKLKSFFYDIKVIEKKIETWMEIKKKLLAKVEDILGVEKSPSSSSSGKRHNRRPMRHRPIIKTTSSSIDESAVSVSTFSNDSHKRLKEVPVSTTKSRGKVDTTKSPPTLHSPTSSPRETRRGMRQPFVSLTKTADLPVVENVDSCHVSQSKIKEELLSSSNTDESPQLNKSRSKRKRRFHPKRKVTNSQAALKTSIISKPVPVVPTSPASKRSSRNKTYPDEKVDKDTPTASEESDSRCSRRRSNQEPLVSLSPNKADDSLLKGTRRRNEKDSPVALNLPSEGNSARSNRRTRQCQVNETNEETIELCILPPNLSRRTKGERKEILIPSEFQNIPSVADDTTKPSPQRATRQSGLCEPAADDEPSPRRARPTRHSICESLTDDDPSPRRATRQAFGEPNITQEIIPLEVKKDLKRKACDMETAVKPPPVKVAPTMRDCRVILEPLVLHLSKKTTGSTLSYQSTISNREDPELSESSHQTESQMADTNLDSDITSDEDDLPLLTIKQKSTPSSRAESVVTKFISDADQHSMSSSDTVLDQGNDDLESGHFKSRKNKTKRTKKDKQYDHHSKNELLEFADHNRGVILDIKVVGRHLLAASEDGFLYSYSMKSGKLKKRYEGHQAAVTCLCTIDGEKESEKSCPEKVVTGSLDDHIRCFLFKTAELMYAPIKIGTALCVDCNWGIIYLGTKLGEVVKVNAKNFSLIGDHMKFSTESILALKATKEGPRKVLIIGTRDQPIAIRDADTGLFLRTVSGAWHHTVCSLLLDKSLVYCGTMSGPIPVFDFTNGQEVFRLHAGVGVRCVKIYHNLLFAGCYDGNIYIYNVKDQSLVHTITGSGKMVLCLDITKNKVIYSCKDALKSINFPPEVSKALKDGKLKVAL